MSKKYTAKEMRLILQGCCDQGYSIIANVQKEIDRIALTPEERLIADNSSERVNSVRRLRSIIASISETLSPAFDISLTLCAHENLVFITQVQEQHKHYLKAIQSMQRPEPVEPPVEEEITQ
jgi:hypothetical protein